MKFEAVYKMSKIVLTVPTLCLIMVLVLVGCRGNEGNVGSVSGQQQGDNYFQSQMTDGAVTAPVQDTTTPTDVDFDMQAPSTPDFSDMSLTPASSEPLYTFDNGYAYVLDPNTLEKSGPPLDPVTKEPIEQEPAEPAGDEEPVEEPTEEPVEEPETTEPTEDTKLPNTGIFFEDD